MKTKHYKVKSIWLAAVLVAAVALFVVPGLVHAQGCAMCYQSAASSGARLIRALKSGIIVLILPPLCLLGLFARMTYRRRNYFGGDDSSEDSSAGTMS